MMNVLHTVNIIDVRWARGHRQQKVEKVGGAEHCYLRGFSLSRGLPPWKFLKNTARRLNLGAFEAKK